MRAFVTGGTGFIGSHLVDALVERGAAVTCAVRPTSHLDRLRNRNVRTEIVDLLDGAGVRRALAGSTHVFHLAGVIAARTEAAYVRVNRDMTRVVAQAAADQGVKRFVHISTIGVCGPSRNGPLDERAPCRPVSIYGRTKLAGEREVLALRPRLRAVVVRPPLVYGPRDRGMLDLFRIAHAGFIPSIGGRKWYSLVHVQDLVEGILKAVEGPPGEVYFISNDDPISSDELGRLLLRAVGRKGIRIYIPEGILLPLGRLSAWVGLRTMLTPDKALEMLQPAWTCTPEKARRVLGFRARIPPAQGLRETVEWYRRNGWLGVP